MKKLLLLCASLFVLMAAFCLQASARDLIRDIVPFDELPSGERIDYKILQEKVDKVYDALGVKTFDLRFTGEFEEIKNKVYEDSNFDVDLFIGNIPDVFAVKRDVQDALGIDHNASKERLFELAEVIRATGNPTLATVTRFIGLLSASPTSMQITVDSDDPSTVRPIQARYEFADGTKYTAEFGSYYDKEQHLMYSEKDNGVIGIGYNLDTANSTLITPRNVWMRNFGFCRAYDVAANYLLPTCYDYDTVRLFYEYDGQDRMLQMWKGTYFITTGAEVGLYDKPKTRLIRFYDCASDDEMLDMELVVTADGKDIVNTPMQKHWWINGFALSKKYYTPDEMLLRCTVVCKDEAMRDAIVEQLEQNTDVLTYTVDGLSITFTW